MTGMTISHDIFSHQLIVESGDVAAKKLQMEELGLTRTLYDLAGKVGGTVYRYLWGLQTVKEAVPSEPEYHQFKYQDSLYRVNKRDFFSTLHDLSPHVSQSFVDRAVSDCQNLPSLLQRLNIRYGTDNPLSSIKQLIDIGIAEDEDFLSDEAKKEFMVLYEDGVDIFSGLDEEERSDPLPHLTLWRDIHQRLGIEGLRYLVCELPQQGHFNPDISLARISKMQDCIIRGKDLEMLEIVEGLYGKDADRCRKLWEEKVDILFKEKRLEAFPFIDIFAGLDGEALLNPQPYLDLWENIHRQFGTERLQDLVYEPLQQGCSNPETPSARLSKMQDCIIRSKNLEMLEIVEEVYGENASHCQKLWETKLDYLFKREGEDAFPFLAGCHYVPHAILHMTAEDADAPETQMIMDLEKSFEGIALDGTKEAFDESLDAFKAKLHLSEISQEHIQDLSAKHHFALLRHYQEKHRGFNEFSRGRGLRCEFFPEEPDEFSWNQVTVEMSIQDKLKEADIDHWSYALDNDLKKYCAFESLSGENFNTLVEVLPPPAAWRCCCAST